MRNKKMKRVATTFLVCVMLMGMSLTTSAVVMEKTTSEGYAGSTHVLAEAGFNGDHGYASVTTSTDVDARLEGTAYYYRGHKDFLGDFSQVSYCEKGANCDSTVIAVICKVSVSSYDGVWSNTLIVQ